MVVSLGEQAELCGQVLLCLSSSKLANHPAADWFSSTASLHPRPRKPQWVYKSYSPMEQQVPDLIE